MFYVLNLKIITEYGVNNVYSVSLIIKICSICLNISNKDWLDGHFFLSCWLFGKEQLIQNSDAWCLLKALK